MQVKLTMGERLQDLMKAYNNGKGITGKELSKKINIATGTISRMLNDKESYSPGSNLIIALSKFFGVSADYLLGLTDVKTTNKDIKFICEYTGLSEEALNNLHQISTIKNIAYTIFSEKVYEFNSDVEYDNYIDGLANQLADCKTDFQFKGEESIVQKHLLNMEIETSPFAILKSKQINECNFDTQEHHERVWRDAFFCLKSINLLLTKENIENVHYKIGSIVTALNRYREYDELSTVALYRLNLYLADMLKETIRKDGVDYDEEK